MLEFGAAEWIVVVAAAVSIGFNKTSSLGVTILFVPLVAGIMPAKQSVGFILPMLCLADVLAIGYWRRHANWSLLARLIPWCLAGLALGYGVLDRVADKTLWPIIGGVILAMIAVTAWRNSRFARDRPVPTYWWFAALMGLLAGVTTMVANAAGPVMVIYLLAMRLDKNQFIGTQAWFFWMVNLLKIVPQIHLGMITKASLATDLLLLPAILVGGLLGIVLVHRISRRGFNLVVNLLAAAAAIHLCLKGLW
ncbi:MAG: sulfite exporter TauE/SafE family protein [Sedimentisphaerales bacterium]|nr:sulfite exporter TauE/SafE family protein [Sedimentisphaerales bacterium]